MADAEHVELVKAGVAAVNAWRRDHYPLGMDLYGAQLFRADLCGADFGGAQLGRANLDGTDLSGADLSGARMVGSRACAASFVGTELRMANLTDARFVDADLTLADLSEADVCGADFSGARFCHTLLGNLDLSQVQGLDRVIHDGPSVLGIDTMFRSGCRIPEVFLRGCGVPDAVLVHAKLWRGRNVSLLTCLVAGVEDDQELCARLAADLQARGVRAWVWPWRRWSDVLTREVERRVRSYDRLVLVAGAKALQTDVLVRELERCVEREREQGGRVLFLLRVGDALDSWKHPDRHRILDREIPDFTDHRRPAAYDESLDALARALRYAPVGLGPA